MSDASVSDAPSAATAPPSTRPLFAPERAVCWVLAIATLVRASAALGALSDPTFGVYRLDEVYYHDLAMQWANGELGAPEGALSMAPAWTALLALTYALVGDAPGWPLLIGHALGVGTTLFSFAIARRFVGAYGALAVAFVYTFFGPALFYESTLMPDTLVTFSLTATAWSWLRWREDRTQAHGLWTGLALGLGILTRPSALLLVPIIAAEVLVASWRDRRLVGGALTAALGVALLVGPVTVRNGVVGDDWVLVTQGGPVNLYIGNGPDANGGWGVPDGWPLDHTRSDTLFVAATTVASARSGRALSPAEVRRFWSAETLAHVRAHPGEWIRLEMLKLDYLLRNKGRLNLRTYSFARHHRGILASPLFYNAGVLLGPGLVGLALLGARRRESWPVLVGAAIPILTMLLFFVLGRYRLSLIPFLAIGAGYGVQTLYTERARRGFVVAISVAVIGLSAWSFRPDSLPEGHANFRRGVELIEVGRCVDAPPFLIEATAYRNLRPLALHQLYEAYLQCEDYVGALEVLAAILEESPERRAELGPRYRALEAFVRSRGTR